MSTTPAPSNQPSVLRKIIMFPLVRIIIGIAMTVVPAMVWRSLIGGILTTESPLVEQIIVTLPFVILSLVGYYLFVRYGEQRPVTELAREGAGKEAVWGLLIGFGLVSAVVVVLLLLGYYEIVGFNNLGFLPVALIGALSAGVGEELLFRGVIFRIVEEYLGSWLALAISALLFGYIHISNPGATWFSSLAIALEAGILLGAAFMLTRRLWLVMGLHYAWNFTQGSIYGVSVSGSEAMGVFIPELSGPEILSGGSFGIEASILAIIFCLAVGIYFVMRAFKEKHIIAPFWQQNSGS